MMKMMTMLNQTKLLLLNMMKCFQYKRVGVLSVQWNVGAMSKHHDPAKDKAVKVTKVESRPKNGQPAKVIEKTDTSQTITIKPKSGQTVVEKTHTVQTVTAKIGGLAKKTISAPLKVFQSSKPGKLVTSKPSSRSKPSKSPSLGSSKSSSSSSDGQSHEPFAKYKPAEDSIATSPQSGGFEDDEDESQTLPLKTVTEVSKESSKDSKGKTTEITDIKQTTIGPASSASSRSSIGGSSTSSIGKSRVRGRKTKRSSLKKSGGRRRKGRRVARSRSRVKRTRSKAKRGGAKTRGRGGRRRGKK